MSTEAPAGPAAPQEPPSQQRRHGLIGTRSLRTSLLGLIAGMLACVAVGLLLGIAAFRGSADPRPRLVLDSTPPAVARRVTMRPVGGARASATAIAYVLSTTTGNVIELHVAGVPPLLQGTYYEFWAAAKQGRGAVALGTVYVDGMGDSVTSVSLPVSLKRFPILDLTLEQADGDPARSGPSVLRGRIE